MARSTARKRAKKPAPRPAKAVEAGLMAGGSDQDVSDMTDVQLGAQIRMICAAGYTAMVYASDGKIWLREQ